MRIRRIEAALVSWFLCGVCLNAATTQERYYAHNVVQDEHGVIAPWYTGANGQFDERIRVAAETLKRYPWTPPGKAPRPLPEYMWSGAWQITPEGTITVPPINDWANGDLGQRAAYVLGSLIDYYRYSGEAWAVAHVALQADALLDFCLTPEDHPWPRFLISVPVRGKPYGPADPRGFIQLDIAAEVGIQMVRAAQLCGSDRYLGAARHWGDLLAAIRIREPGVNPWPRYANPGDAPWEDIAKGGVAFILEFFDELIKSGYTGENGAIVEARNAGVAYLRDVLLPDWLGHDTWGRNYWDWPCNVQVENVTEFVCRYLMDHPDEFPNWKSDARNIATLFINRTCAAPKSAGDTFHGAWAYPESSGCCGRSLWYGPLELVQVYAQLASLIDKPSSAERREESHAEYQWAHEMARRQLILATYDFHPTGVVEDNIDGGAIVAGSWFKIAHPMALKHCLAAIAWMPETFAPPAENHIVRSSTTVTSVSYDAGRISYSVASSSDHTETLVETLRISFEPSSVTAGGPLLKLQGNLLANGYTARAIGGDWLVRIRHDGAPNVLVQGQDPRKRLDGSVLDFAGLWQRPSGTISPAQDGVGESGTAPYITAQGGAAMLCAFEGDQVQVLGMANENGGLADVYIDGVKQLGGIDCYAPVLAPPQVLFHRSGLGDGNHALKILVRGEKNPASNGSDVAVEAVLCSAAARNADQDWGGGGGPTQSQRWIFGYPYREDYVDSRGHAWRPATEWVVRAGNVVDTVAAAWYTSRRQLVVAGTSEPELYRYGAHGKDFWADFTVGPGSYHVRLKFCETRRLPPPQRAVTVLVNGTEFVSGLDIAATAAGGAGAAGTQPEKLAHAQVIPGMGRAVDLVFNGIKPRHGTVSVRFKGTAGGEAIVQAIEVGPGEDGPGAPPITIQTAGAGAVDAH